MANCITVGFDRLKDLVPQANFLDVRHIGMSQKKELVSKDEVRLLSFFLTLH